MCLLRNEFRKCILLMSCLMLGCIKEDMPKSPPTKVVQDSLERYYAQVDPLKKAYGPLCDDTLIRPLQEFCYEFDRSLSRFVFSVFDVCRVLGTPKRVGWVPVMEYRFPKGEFYRVGINVWMNNCRAKTVFARIRQNSPFPLSVKKELNEWYVREIEPCRVHRYKEWRTFQDQDLARKRLFLLKDNLEKNALFFDLGYDELVAMIGPPSDSKMYDSTFDMVNLTFDGDELENINPLMYGFARRMKVEYYYAITRERFLRLSVSFFDDSRSLKCSCREFQGGEFVPNLFGAISFR